MKRLNPDTGKPFQQGDIRDDCYRFWSYKTTISKKTGFFYETWRSWEEYERWTTEGGMNAVQRNWAKRNPDKCNAKQMKYKVSKKNRTPPWLTKDHLKQIEEFYTRAKIAEDFTGVKYDVDHIEPIQGKDICGLHVPWNLQLLPKKENMKKGNRRVEKESAPSVSKRNARAGQTKAEHRIVHGTGPWENCDGAHHSRGEYRQEDLDCCAEEGGRVCMDAGV